MRQFVSVAVLLFFVLPVPSDVPGMVDEAAAQVSSEIPGVPSAGIPTLSRSRQEVTFEFGFAWGPPDPDTRRFGESRISMNRTFRVVRNLEVGAELTLIDGSVHVPEAGEGRGDRPTRIDGSAAYGFALGAKYRFLSLMDLDRRGVEVALLGSWRPTAEPAFRMELEGDNVRRFSGFLTSDDEEGDGVGHPREVPGGATIGLAGGFRHNRIQADLSVLRHTYRTVPSPWIPGESGTDLKAGFLVELRPSLSVGATYWGNGAPPWANAPIRSGITGESGSSVGLLIGRDGDRRGAGTRFLFTSPTDNFGESIRIMIHTFRSL